MKVNKTLSKPSILFLLNDFSLGGANKLLLEFCKWLSRNKNYDLFFASSKDGILREDFSKLGESLIITLRKPSIAERFIKKLFNFRVIIEKIHKEDLRNLKNRNFKLIFANTIHNEKLANSLKRYIQAPMVVYVHEQPYIMNLYNTPEMRYHLASANNFITVSGTSAVGLNSLLYYSQKYNRKQKQCQL